MFKQCQQHLCRRSLSPSSFLLLFLFLQRRVCACTNTRERGKENTHEQRVSATSNHFDSKVFSLARLPSLLTDKTMMQCFEMQSHNHRSDSILLFFFSLPNLLLFHRSRLSTEHAHARRERERRSGVRVST